MLSYTTDFKNAALSNIRNPSALIIVDWENPTSDTNVTISASETNYIDRKGQIYNGVGAMGNKWYHLHSNLTIDDSFKLCPEKDGSFQMGWFGSQVCDTSGGFTTNPLLTVTHDPRNYNKVILYGDSEYNEYPVDFSISLSHTGGTHNILIAGNTSVNFEQELPTHIDVVSIQVEITKWSTPDSIVKIAQFGGFLTEEYESSDINSIDILEETNSDTGLVPIGNVSSNELDLSLLNSDNRFSFGNSDSLLVNSLKTNRKITAWLGFKLPTSSADQTGDVPGYVVKSGFGYMPWGIYWSKDWVSNYNSLETTTTGYDLVYRLSQYDYLESLNFTGTVESIVNAILTSAKFNLPDLKWEVSPNIASIVLTNVAFPVADYLTVLKNICVVTLSYSYVDRTGTLIVGSRLEVETPVQPEQQIGLSEYYDYQSVPKTDELVNTVRVGYTNYVLEEEAKTLYSNEEEVFTIPAQGEIELYIRYSSSVVKADTVTIQILNASGVVTVTELEKYAVGARLTVSGTVGLTFQIVATGIAYELDENTETIADLPESVLTYGARELEITGNQLITSETQASEIATNLINFYGNLRTDGKLTWNGSTLVSVGDTVEVTEFKSDTVETKDYFLINRQTINYNGSLNSELELRRG